jgi:hypothetical protein
MAKSDYVPIYLMVPRSDSLKHTPCSDNDVKTLQTILKNFNNVLTRGNKRSGLASAYATAGATVCQGKKGISFKLPVCASALCHAQTMIRRMEHLAKMWLPFGLLSTLEEMKDICNDKVSFIGNNIGKRSVWASIATSFNYVSPAHIDHDAFLSCLTVSYVPKNHDGKNPYRYTERMDVALYFCFPQYKFCIALRPGDVIFFNPLEYHCISQRTSSYQEEEVFVTSFYIKSKQLGLNDNGIIIDNLCNEEDEVLKQAPVQQS